MCGLVKTTQYDDDADDAWDVYVKQFKERQAQATTPSTMSTAHCEETCSHLGQVMEKMEEFLRDPPCPAPETEELMTPELKKIVSHSVSVGLSQYCSQFELEDQVQEILFHVKRVDNSRNLAKNETAILGGVVEMLETVQSDLKAYIKKMQTRQRSWIRGKATPCSTNTNNN